MIVVSPGDQAKEPPVNQSTSSVRAAIQNPASPGRDLLAGTTTGVVAIVRDLSLASLIFSGLLGEYAFYGAGLALACAVVIRLVVALWSSQPAVVASLEDAPAAIFAVGAFAAVRALPAGSTSAEMFATVVVFAALTAAICGLFFLLLGTFRLGYLVRFVPYPVVGGFLAGVGYLLVAGSLRVMTGQPFRLVEAGMLFQSGVPGRWLGGAGIAVLLLVLMRIRKHYLILPGVLVAGVIGFYAILLLSGVSLDQARQGGYVMGPFPPQPIWKPHLWHALGEVRWEVIWPQAMTLVAVPLVSVMSLLLNATGMELATRRDVDLNRELRVAGLANLLGAGVGEIVGYQSNSMSAMLREMGGRGRLAGLAAAGVAGVFLLAGHVLLNYLPKAVLGGMLMYFGISLLIRCLFTSRRQLPWGDYAVLLMILLVVALAGFAQGVGAGIFAAVLLFVVRSSRLNVVKRQLSGAQRRSNVDRPAEHRRELERAGDHVTILQLAGYLFFGTSFQLLQQVRRRLEDASRPPLHYLVLDFRLVSGIDSSAVFSFVRMRQMAEGAGFWLVCTGLGPLMLVRMRRTGVVEASGGAVRVFRDLDHGIEWVEDSLLRSRPLPAPQSASLREALGRIFGPQADLDRLSKYLQREELPRGAVLMHQGDPSDDICFIESGRVTVKLALDSGKTIRLRTMQAGTVVGEIGYYLGQPRTASVVAAEPTIVHRLGGQALDEMTREDAATAAAFHRYMAALLAERLTEANRHLRAMTD